MPEHMSANAPETMSEAAHENGETGRSGPVRRLIALMVIALGGLAAVAQEPSRASIAETALDEETITIVGRGAASSADIRSFVRAVSTEGQGDQIARWDRAICPAFLGIDDAHADYLASAIRDVAMQVRPRLVSDQDCRPNVHILFTETPDDLITEIEQVAPEALPYINTRARRQFLDATNPVRWAARTDIIAAGGAIIVKNIQKGTNRSVPLIKSRTGSRLHLSVELEVQSMLVVVDARELAGITNSALADYLAFVVIANADPRARTVSQPSILNLFATGADEPAHMTAGYNGIRTLGLTSWDRLYLSSLYKGSNNVKASLTRARIGRGLRRGMRAADEAPNMADDLFVMAEEQG